MKSPYISTAATDPHNVILPPDIEQSVQNHVNMACKYERIQLILYIVKRTFGELPEELAMAVHLFKYNELLELLDTALDAGHIDEVIDASNRLMAKM